MTHPLNTRQGGFTLIEVLMVLAIFSLTMLIGVEVFMTASRTQRRTQDEQRVQSDARFTIEMLAREVRSGVPNYARYVDLNEDGTDNSSSYTDRLDLAGVTTILAIKEADGAETIVRKSPTNYALDPWKGDGNKLEICTSGCSLASNVNWTDITPPEVSISRFSVLITPTANPFALQPTPNDGSYYNDIQPSVTLAIEMVPTSTAGAAQPQTYQTTITSRLYYR